jgi:hypothetical protein
LKTYLSIISKDDLFIIANALSVDDLKILVEALGERAKSADLNQIIGDFEYFQTRLPSELAGLLIETLSFKMKTTPSSVSELKKFEDEFTSKFSNEYYLSRFMSGLISRAPAVISAEYISTYPSALFTKETYDRISSLIAKDDPQKALEWANNIPPDVKVNALYCAAVTWAQKDVNALGDYTNNSQNGLLKEVCATALAIQHELNGMTKEATLWASSVSNPILKVKLIQSIKD